VISENAQSNSSAWSSSESEKSQQLIDNNEIKQLSQLPNQQIGTKVLNKVLLTIDDEKKPKL